MEDVEREFMANRGYYKASEVALQVIGKIERKIRKYRNNVVNPYDYIKAELAELKKKYTKKDGE